MNLNMSVADYRLRPGSGAEAPTVAGLFRETIVLSANGVNRRNVWIFGHIWLFTAGIADNCRVTLSSWQKRIKRAKELSEQHAFAREILGFYIHVARFQEDLHAHMAAEFPVPFGNYNSLAREELSVLSERFPAFLSLTEKHGPNSLGELTRELNGRGKDFWEELLRSAWTTHSTSNADFILALMFLQPWAEVVRSRATKRATNSPYALCPFCQRKPALGVMRQMGDGASRSLICAFCGAEWEFRRIVCAGCGEENDKKLALFTANEFGYIRVECCDSCKTYLKTIDLTKNGLAEPIVDEMASAPLDLWARENGYAKLQVNILGM